MALTPQLLEGSLVFMIIGYAIALAFQIYVLYLNWKQSKVNDQMTQLLEEVKIIRKEIQNKKNK
ncbi:hypothetical protein K9L97_05570 [Candidatus Woesearchaeota archaeon]|nr:hypothetical protein [Candidatus Woesearchaeota archaeon]